AMWKGTWRTVGSSLLAGVVAYPVRWLLRDEHVAIAALATLPLFGVVFLAAAHHAGSGEAARLLRRMHLLRR
ncbi:MAG TPA: hypothetical protein VJ596_09875, partial [Gemmatimonadaceae bacterium]|nr:hypothetical protein [Gemmatimonadaceae bacterium]